ncbi:PTS lactose/cellobiose transporter subunit IIA [Facklamia sp. P12945]|uniref:PTS lactose/cellobiose transporter subunit IIA n=1 Tax=unclassified Facklamia TaxID=2622293 RepID=UPI003D178B9D
MKVEEVQEIAMLMIANGGDARSQSMEAIRFAKEGNFDLAQQKFALAQESILTAHQLQTKLLVGEAQGNSSKLSLLMIHAQDHLMNAMTVNDMAKEIVDLYQLILPNHKKFK